MPRGSGGAVIHVSSATSLRFLRGLSGYSASRAGLNILSQVERLELTGAVMTVSVVHPSILATEFHQRLRAGQLVRRARRIPADPRELVGAAIAGAICDGEAHVLVADPPRPMVRGDLASWGTLLAGQDPDVRPRSHGSLRLRWPRLSGEGFEAASGPAAEWRGRRRRRSAPRRPRRGHGWRDWDQAVAIRPLKWLRSAGLRVKSRARWKDRCASASWPSSR